MNVPYDKYKLKYSYSSSIEHRDVTERNQLSTEFLCFVCYFFSKIDGCLWVKDKYNVTTLNKSDEYEFYKQV